MCCVIPTIRRRRAAATVEFAVLAPLLIFLVVVGVDFARVYYFALTLSNAARNGAVYGSGSPERAQDTTKIQSLVLADTSNLSPTPTVTTSQTTDAAGNPALIVSVSWDFNTVVSYPGIPRPFTLTRSVQMRIAPTQPQGSY
jgi:Flp pilus assembly protein TadG